MLLKILVGLIVITLIHDQYQWSIWLADDGMHPNILMYLLNLSGLVLLISILFRTESSPKLIQATLIWALLNFTFGVYNFQMFQPALGEGVYFWFSNLLIHLLIMLPVILYCKKLKHNKSLKQDK